MNLQIPPPGFWRTEITNEAAALLKHIPEDRDILGAEVGVQLAKSACILLHRRPRLSLLLVDSWQEIPEAKDLAVANLESIGAAGRYRIIHGDSTERAAGIPDGSLDYAFIDASKVREKYRADCLAWLPKVRPTGFLAGHDWHMASVPPVVEELSEMLRRPAILYGQRKVWVIELA